jgi:CCR4-NOT transcriptional complex subunit CAF120
MNGAQGGSLQNVLSISTAANNRYLLHFNSLNSLTQWTAGIRLAMHEHASLQEAYTGSLIAGKGRYLNGIRQIMERTRYPYDDWARVRFGAGTPWRRCWCVISPPDEKEYQKAQKLVKKGGAYSRAQVPKGDIKFYESRKVTKKTQPIATISDAYAAYAIYPQSKPLIEQSTLVKLEGLVTLHGPQDTTTEGFVFVMPEVHAAVSGFEMMLKWLFPVYDTFALYGRPSRLIADTLDQRGLMFAMPKDRRYGYLDILDVSGLIHTGGSHGWSERQWRKELRKLTSTRMTAMLEDGGREPRGPGYRRNTVGRSSLPPSRSGVQLQESIIHSTPGSRSGSPSSKAGLDSIASPPKRVESAPPQAFHGSPHKRSVSDAPGLNGYRRYAAENPSRLSHEYSSDSGPPPPPPKHGGVLGVAHGQSRAGSSDSFDSSPPVEGDSPYEQVVAASPFIPPPEVVQPPPQLQHNAHARPANQPHVAPELRRAHSNVDEATLHQMQEAQLAQYDDSTAGTPEHEQSSAGVAHTLAHRGQLSVPADPSQNRNGGYAPVKPNYRQPPTLQSIPGSPCATHEGEYFHDASEQPSIDQVATNARPGMLASQSRESVTKRKPVPRHPAQLAPEAELAQEPSRIENSPQQVRNPPSSPNNTKMDTPSSPSSLYSADSFVDDTIGFVDEGALERILNDGDDRLNTIASTETPDYASTASRPSFDDVQVKKEKVFARPGKLKTVGDPSLPAVQERGYGSGKLDTWNKDKEQQAAPIPSVDFGPTYAYKPTSRPGTSGTLSPSGKENRPQSRDRLRQSSRLSGHFDGAIAVTPESNRNSYFGPRTPTPTGLEPGDLGGMQNKRQSIAWTASGASPNHTGQGQERKSLTPEQWVQYRAELAMQPQYAPPRKSLAPPLAHVRHASTGNMPQSRKSMSKTPPPFQRTASGDWTGVGQQRTPFVRPHSRGASVYLNPHGTLLSNQGTTLTAREQMEIARMTNTPMVSVAKNPAKKGVYNDAAAEGLIGALAAREREKASLSKGLRGAAVQDAIAQRYQDQYQAEVDAVMQAQYQQQRMAQQQAMQAAQYQQLMYQQAVMSQQRNSVVYAQPVPQEHVMPAPVQSRMSWGPGMMQQQTMAAGYGMTAPAPSQAGGYGGQYVQQQGMMSQQPGQAYGYGPGQQQQQQQQQQQPQQQQQMGGQHPRTGRR